MEEIPIGKSSVGISSGSSSSSCWRSWLCWKCWLKIVMIVMILLMIMMTFVWPWCPVMIIDIIPDFSLYLLITKNGGKKMLVMVNFVSLSKSSFNNFHTIHKKRRRIILITCGIFCCGSWYWFWDISSFHNFNIARGGVCCCVHPLLVQILNICHIEHNGGKVYAEYIWRFFNVMSDSDFDLIHCSTVYTNVCQLQIVYMNSNYVRHFIPLFTIWNMLLQHTQALELQKEYIYFCGF